MGLINSFGALSAFIGAWLVGVINDATGSASASYVFMGTALILSVVLMASVKAPKAN